jgi:hypothetical protein
MVYKHCSQLDGDYPDIQDFVDDNNILLAKEELLNNIPKTDNAELISNILKEKNGNFGIKIILNNQLIFYSLNQFREHVNENSWPFDPSIITIRIEIHDFSQEKVYNSNQTENYTENNYKLGSFDYNIFEVDLNQMKSFHTLAKLLPPLDNTAIILCHPSEKVNKFDTSIEIIKKISDSCPLVVVFTKPENLASFSQIVGLKKKIQSVNETRWVKSTFLRLRNNEDRREEVSKFYLKETTFYQSELLKSNSRRFGYEDISSLLLETITQNFGKNFNETKTIIEDRLEAYFKDFEDLGQTIPEENENKFENLKFKLKKLIIYLQSICEYYSDALKYYIETEIYQIDNMVDEDLTKCSLIKQFKIIYNDVIPEHIKSNLSDLKKNMKIKSNLNFNFNEFSKSLNSCRIKLLNEIDKSFTVPIFRENLESSKTYLFQKINEIFKNTSEDFIDKVSIFFESVFNIKEGEMMQNMKRNIEIELNHSHNIYKNKALFSEMKNFYTEKIFKNEFSFEFNEDYENFISKYLEKCLQFDMNKLIEQYSKFYIFDFYLKIIEFYKDKSIDFVIKQIINHDLEIYKEKEEFKEKRVKLERSLNKLIKVLEIMTSISTFTKHQNQGLDSSMMANSVYQSKVSNLNTSVNKFMHKLSSINTNMEKYKTRLEKFISVTSSSLEDEKKFEEPEENEDFNLNETVPHQTENCFLTSEIIIGEEYNVGIPTKVQAKEVDYQLEDKLHEEIKFEKINRNDFNFTPPESTHEVIMIWDNTNSISVYNIKENKLSHEYLNNIPGLSFLEDNRYLNIKNDVYIAGGSNENKIKQDKFIKLSRLSNTVHELKNIPIAVIRHSMIYLPTIKSILLLGGKDTRSSFIYSTTEDSWSFAGELKCERTDASLILVNQSLVLCLGGVKEKELRMDCFFIEAKIFDQESLNSLVNWTEFAVKGDDQILTSLSYVSGFGAVILNDKSLILLGGYNLSSLEDEEKAYSLSIINEGIVYFLF